AAGQQGAQGCRAAGRAGQTGQQGAQDCRAAGRAGRAGLQCAQGAQGSWTAGHAGRAGLQGAWGAAGLQGVRGAQGSSKGCSGNSRAAGRTGLQGSRAHRAAGKQGAQGCRAAGRAGQTGQQGAQGCREAGRTGLQGSRARGARRAARQGAGAGGAGAGDTGAVDPGAGGAGAGVLCLTVLLLVALCGRNERREPESCPSVPVCAVRIGRWVPRLRPTPDLCTHAMALCSSSVPLRVPLPPPPQSSLPAVPHPESDLACAASPAVSRLLATVVTGPSFESSVASALVAELVDFAAACRLDYATALVAESESVSPPFVGGECALGPDVVGDRQEDFQCLASAVPHLVSMLIAPEGDPDAPDIPTPRSYAEAITGPYSSQWQTAMDAETASWKSTGTYVDAVPPSGANIVDGMWIYTVKRPPGSPPAFKARYRDYELHSLDFSTAFLQGSLHEEIWLRRPRGFTGSFPARTQWSLRRPVYGLCQAPREWHDTLRTTLAALGFAPLTADPSLFLRTDTSLLPFYVLMYVLQRFDFQFSSLQPTPLSTGHSLSAPPSDES
ncbi:unnamed protein product, partial [Closterium sp. NIES-53]